MTVTLEVDGDRWRAHLQQAVAAEPDLVPVVKGNGYGFGNHRLARRAAWLGVDTVAVGTYPELADVEQRFDGDLVLLAPWRGFLDGARERLADPRVVHTVGRLEDLQEMAASGARPRVLLERMTSMKRHGFTARGLRTAAAGLAGVRFEGISLHFPLSSGNLRELEAAMTDVVAAGLASDGLVVWISHLSATDLAAVRAQYPEVRFRPRVGTALWLGDRNALHVHATVLDVHPVDRGEEYGYRLRSAPRGGTIVVVSGGTAHGIGLESPTGETSLRARAASLARGGLDAVGASRSPYVVAGKQRFFAEPPHMQSSMLYLPPGAEVPEVGDDVSLHVRFTATWFDRVEIS